jgi:DNA-binding IclR family transcriptional regulator
MTIKTEENNDKTTTIRAVPALTRGIKILRHLAKSDQPLGVNQVARSTDLIPSTCLHILRTLVEEGLVNVDEETKRYSLGVGILPIARTAILRNGFNQIVQPHLDTLANEFEITSIGIEKANSDHMIAVAIARSQMPFRLQVDIGSRFPSLISATGRCFAAFGNFSKSQLKQQFQKLTWGNPPSFEEWESQVSETKSRGFGLDSGQYIPGVTVISAPIRNKTGGISHCVVSVGVTEQMIKKGIDPLANKMLEVSKICSESLFN